MDVQDDMQNYQLNAEHYGDDEMVFPKEQNRKKHIEDVTYEELIVRFDYMQ